MRNMQLTLTVLLLAAGLSFHTASAQTPVNIQNNDFESWSSDDVASGTYLLKVNWQNLEASRKLTLVK